MAERLASFATQLARLQASMQKTEDRFVPDLGGGDQSAIASHQLSDLEAMFRTELKSLQKQVDDLNSWEWDYTILPNNSGK